MANPSLLKCFSSSLEMSPNARLPAHSPLHCCAAVCWNKRSNCPCLHSCPSLAGSISNSRTKLGWRFLLCFSYFEVESLVDEVQLFWKRQVLASLACILSVRWGRVGLITLRSCEVAGWCETSDGWAICAACNDLVVALCPSGRSHGVLGLHSGWSSLAGAVRAVRVKLVPSWSHHRNCRLHFLSLIILSSVNYSSYQPIILAIIGEITFPLINLNNKCQ